MKNRGIAIVLALFLGGLGIHRFYVGQVAWGFVFLFFWWTFIPVFFSLIDVIRWSAMSEATFKKRYSYDEGTLS